MKVKVIFYSYYGHIYKMAEVVARGAEQVAGGNPYGANTITGGDGSRMPSENELAMAHFQGRHAASMAKKIRNA